MSHKKIENLRIPFQQVFLIPSLYLDLGLIVFVANSVSNEAANRIVDPVPISHENLARSTQFYTSSRRVLSNRALPVPLDSSVVFLVIDLVELGDLETQDHFCAVDREQVHFAYPPFYVLIKNCTLKEGFRASFLKFYLDNNQLDLVAFLKTTPTTPSTTLMTIRILSTLIFYRNANTLHQFNFKKYAQF